MELAAKLRSYWREENPYAAALAANDLACRLQGALTEEAEDGGWLSDFLRAVGPESGRPPENAAPTQGFIESLDRFIEDEPGCFVDVAQGIEACSRCWADGIVEFIDGTIFEFSPYVDPKSARPILAAQGENPLKAPTS